VEQHPITDACTIKKAITDSRLQSLREMGDEALQTEAGVVHTKRSLTTIRSPRYDVYSINTLVSSSLNNCWLQQAREQSPTSIIQGCSDS